MRLMEYYSTGVRVVPFRYSESINNPTNNPTSLFDYWFGEKRALSAVIRLQGISPLFLFSPEGFGFFPQIFIAHQPQHQRHTTPYCIFVYVSEIELDICRSVPESIHKFRIDFPRFRFSFAEVFFIMVKKTCIMRQQSEFIDISIFSIKITHPLHFK